MYICQTVLYLDAELRRMQESLSVGHSKSTTRTSGPQITTPNSICRSTRPLRLRPSRGDGKGRSPFRFHLVLWNTIPYGGQGQRCISETICKFRLQFTTAAFGLIVGRIESFGCGAYVQEKEFEAKAQGEEETTAGEEWLRCNNNKSIASFQSIIACEHIRIIRKGETTW